MTRTDHENSGTRRMFMPGARVVSTVVASEIAIIVSPPSITPKAAMNNATNLLVPPPGPPLAMIDKITRSIPKNQAQKPAAARRANASERAPSCSGTTATARPSMTGSTAKRASPTR